MGPKFGLHGPHEGHFFNLVQNRCDIPMFNQGLVVELFEKINDTE